MLEIDKLRQRLSNVGRNVIEYRMTVSEAQALVKEFEVLEKQLLEKPKIVIQKETYTTPRIIDGGEF